MELNLSIEDESELNVRLNKNTGEWDFEVLANAYDKDKLIEWGFKPYEFWFNTDVVHQDQDDFISEHDKRAFGGFGGVKIMIGNYMQTIGTKEDIFPELEDWCNRMMEKGDTEDQALIQHLLKFEV